MNSIRPVPLQQYNSVSGSGAIRKAAVNAEMPKLTEDESELIKEKFTASNKLDLYSMDGKVKEQHFSRGLNIDTKA